MNQYTRSIKWNNKEVQNPILRKLVVLIVFILLPLFFVWGTLMLIVFLPILLVLHPFFRLFGLVGTVRQEGYGKVSIKLDRDSFRRR